MVQGWLQDPCEMINPRLHSDRFNISSVFEPILGRVLGAEGKGEGEGSDSGDESAKEDSRVCRIDHVRNEVIREQLGQERIVEKVCRKREA